MLLSSSTIRNFIFSHYPRMEFTLDYITPHKHTRCRCSKCLSELLTQFKRARKEALKKGLYGSGGRIRTYDLWVMLATTAFAAWNDQFVVWTFSSPSTRFPAVRVPAIKSLHLLQWL